jgi:hypothetical protein
LVGVCERDRRDQSVAKQISTGEFCKLLTHVLTIITNVGKSEQLSEYRD